MLVVTYTLRLFMSKREDILQATIDVVAKQGIASSSTEQIAKEAGAPL